ncbi:MAG: tetratricopeptide repeat protein, partial [Pseudonocardiales bacterium]|nr:tetratricopeptide repeat protein [Pseudonocardiales bacterium]
SAYVLALSLWGVGQYESARQLGEDTLARCRRVLGEDHPHTLRSANNLARDLRELGEDQQARDLEEWITRQRGA